LGSLFLFLSGVFPGALQFRYLHSLFHSILSLKIFGIKFILSRDLSLGFLSAVKEILGLDRTFLNNLFANTKPCDGSLIRILGVNLGVAK
jgi:hypothetical protein